MKVDINLSDRTIDIASAGLDVAIRVGRNLPPDMIAVRIGDCPHIVCGSPAYIARCGAPKTLDQLENHDCLVLPGIPNWPFMCGDEERTIKPEGRFVASTIDGLAAACVGGIGIGFIVYWDVELLLKSGALVKLDLADAKPVNLSIWAVFPTRRHVPPRVRMLIDALRNKLSSFAAATSENW